MIGIPPFVIACDFDGTIACDDVGNNLFKTFAGAAWSGPVLRWKAGEISSRECLTQECALAKADTEALDAFIESCTIEPSFISFYRSIQKAGWPFFVVSDGLSYYINRMLYRYALTNIPVYSNTLIVGENQFIPEFPGYNYTCGKCGNCKTNHLEQWRNKGDNLVYIGDGLSDRCAAENADIVFAKKDLAKYCTEKGIDFVSFSDFDDILEHLNACLCIHAQEKVDKLTE